MSSEGKRTVDDVLHDYADALREVDAGGPEGDNSFTRARDYVRTGAARELAPASEVERLTNALCRIADENDPLEGIGSEMAFARATLHPDEEPS